MRYPSSFWMQIALLFFLVAAIAKCAGEKDDTDGPEGRSGMVLYTDAKTGCQYLGTGLSALTPRLDRDGKPICGGTP